MELISREEAIQRIQKVEQEPNYQHDYEGWRDGLIIAENIVDELPTVEERKEGRWIPFLPEYEDMFECSKCKVIVRLPFKATRMPYKYCPNCGARMF